MRLNTEPCNEQAATTGSTVEMSGDLVLSGDAELTLSAGSSLVVSEPPAERRLMTRADIERLLAEVQPEPLSPAERDAIRSITEPGHLEPLSPAAVDHLLGWYTAADRAAEVQRLLALGEVQSRLAPMTLAQAATQQHARLLAEVMGSTANYAPILPAEVVQAIGRQMIEQVTLPAAEVARVALERTAIAAAGAVQSVARQAITSMAVDTSAAIVAQQRELAGMLSTGPAAWGIGSRRRWAEPELERAAEVMQVAPADWRAVLTVAIKGGQASPKEVAAWLHGMAQQHGPGQKPADWAEIEAVALMYKAHGSEYDNQGAFVGYLARKGMTISVSTLQRWLAEYERVTGEHLRPGRGSRRRGSL